MAHHNKLPAAGVNPALMPTAAEKAALDAATAPDANNPFVTHGPAGDVSDDILDALTGAQAPDAANVFVTTGPAGNITTAQIESIINATAPDAANPFMTHGPAGDLTDAQLAALQIAPLGNIPSNAQKDALDDSTSPPLGSSNPVAGRNDLVVVGRGEGLTGNVTWTTGRPWLNGTQYKAIGLFFPSTGQSQSVVGMWTGANVTFNSLTGTGTLTAIIFRQATIDLLT